MHVAPLDQAGYLTKIAHVPRPGGTVALHHADGYYDVIPILRAPADPRPTT